MKKRNDDAPGEELVVSFQDEQMFDARVAKR